MAARFASAIPVTRVASRERTQCIQDVTALRECRASVATACFQRRGNATPAQSVSRNVRHSGTCRYSGGDARGRGGLRTSRPAFQHSEYNFGGVKGNVAAGSSNFSQAYNESFDLATVQEFARADRRDLRDPRPQRRSAGRAGRWRQRAAPCDRRPCGRQGTQAPSRRRRHEPTQARRPDRRQERGHRPRQPGRRRAGYRDSSPAPLGRDSRSSRTPGSGRACGKRPMATPAQRPQAYLTECGVREPPGGAARVDSRAGRQRGPSRRARKCGPRCHQKPRARPLGLALGPNSQQKGQTSCKFTRGRSPRRGQGGRSLGTGAPETGYA